MMVAPAAADRKVQLIPPAAFERPAVVLHRLLEHVERMKREGGLFVVGDGHPAHSPMWAKQSEAVANQPDTRFRRRTRVHAACPWDKRATHSFGARRSQLRSPNADFVSQMNHLAALAIVFAARSSSATRAESASFSARARAAIALTASNSSRGTKSMSATS